ncbi:hypothetical protein GOP47_0006662 [Adiantum capillus-veneris]|uniref:Uncharacterized protein n=1 Tax=Adiantum capillus-veneris TaxID=13818 RepID=A0A9D4V3B1_ADICA|nr:hypothetical protein GOP47_0006662 [Adiantum capillus-veneris]
MFCSQVVNGSRNHECRCLAGLRVTSNASGIMCFLCSPLEEPEMEYYECIHDSTAYYYLMVLNPVTGSSMRLPPNDPKCAARLKSWFPFPFPISLQSLPAHHYRLFLWEHRNGNLEFYDSSSRSWTVGRAAVGDQRDVRFATAVDLEQADLMVLLIACGQFSGVIDDRRFLACSVKLDDWCKVRVPPLPALFHRYVDCQIILRHQGLILLAAVVSTEDYCFVISRRLSSWLRDMGVAAASEVQLLGYFFFCTCWRLGRSGKNTSSFAVLGGYQSDRRIFQI